MVYSFISYSSNDLHFAEKLEGNLINDHVEVWRDRSRLRGDHNWDDEIENALSDPNLTHLVVLLSPHSIASEMVKNEIEYGRREGKVLVVAKIAECKLPLLLARKNFIDFTRNYELAYQLLLKTFEAFQPPKIKPVKEYVVPISTLKLTSQQIDAAHDTNQLIRLVAAPGTGKSLVIEERVRWSLLNGFNAKTIAVVSFTRASSRDLKDRIINFCKKDNLNQVEEVSVTTLHSLALRALRKAKLLHYPADPQVLDEWELENIFDAEFSNTMRNTSPGLAELTPSRAEEVREAWEAYWNTGKWNPPNYIRPKNPVTDIEKDAFNKFHGAATLVYSCVLPGEIIKMCIDRIETGILDPKAVLGIEHLIVDEYQDLNYTDLQFIDFFINNGIPTFVAGDDDQSIYSFRYAYPKGIQTFADTYKPVAKVNDHTLTECFRCTPHVLKAGQTLISHYQNPERIAKTVFSFCKDFVPNLKGNVYRWKFKSEKAEFTAIANSCKNLIDQGIKPRNILILISDRKALLPKSAEKPTLLEASFQRANVPIDMPSGKRYIDTDSGRFVYSLIRTACDSDLQDYISHRTILGSLKGIGLTTISNIRSKVISNDLKYLDLFYNELPEKIFNPREAAAIERVKDICEKIRAWESTDTLISRKHVIEQMTQEIFDDAAAQNWLRHVDYLPDEMNLEEIRAYLSTDNSEQQEVILNKVYDRLDLQIPEEGLLPQQVRVMTMHGAKGLNADVVFIPGLEETILPGEKRSPYPGLIQEGARQVYVSVTRARLTCFVSYSTTRMKYNKPDFGRSASQYCTYLDGKFQDNSNGLTSKEVEEIIESGKLYKTHMDTRLSQL